MQRFEMLCDFFLLSLRFADYILDFGLDYGGKTRTYLRVFDHRLSNLTRRFFLHVKIKADFARFTCQVEHHQDWNFMTRFLPPLCLNLALLLPIWLLLIISVACRIKLRKLAFFVSITIVALHNLLRDLFAIFISTQAFLFWGNFICWSRSSPTFVSSLPILLICV